MNTSTMSNGEILSLAAGHEPVLTRLDGELAELHRQEQAALAAHDGKQLESLWSAIQAKEAERDEHDKERSRLIAEVRDRGQSALNRLALQWDQTMERLRAERQSRIETARTAGAAFVAALRHLEDHAAEAATATRRLTDERVKIEQQYQALGLPPIWNAREAQTTTAISPQERSLAFEETRLQLEGLVQPTPRPLWLV